MKKEELEKILSGFKDRKQSRYAEDPTRQYLMIRFKDGATEENLASLNGLGAKEIEVLKGLTKEDALILAYFPKGTEEEIKRLPNFYSVNEPGPIQLFTLAPNPNYP